LSGQDGIVATLTYFPEHRTLAQVETADGAWTLKHRGFPASTVTLREIGSKVDHATFHPHLSGKGKLVFLNGDTFAWVRLEGDEPGGAFLDPHGMSLVRLSLCPDTSHRAIPEDIPLALVDAGRLHRCHAGPALLATLGWYLLQFETILEEAGTAAEMSLRI